MDNAHLSQVAPKEVSTRQGQASSLKPHLQLALPSSLPTGIHLHILYKRHKKIL